MGGFIARRLLQGLMLLVLVATVVFFLGRLTGNPVEHSASTRQRTQGILPSAPYGALLAHLTLPRLACQGQGAGATVQEISYHKATGG